MNEQMISQLNIKIINEIYNNKNSDIDNVQ